jgi:hypothetical protein
MKFRLQANPRDPAQRDYRQKVKAQGKKHHILRMGVIRFGGRMFVVMTALDLLRHAPSGYMFDIAANRLIWPFSGHFWGLLMWHYWVCRFENQTHDGIDRDDETK